MTIIDRRKDSKGKSTANRQRFLDRYKRKVKKSVDTLIDKRNIKDVFDSGEITISGDDLNEPTFRHNPRTGDKEYVLPGNKEHTRGDTFDKPKSGEGAGGTGGSPEGDSEDEFSFTLTKEEFLDIYFKDLALPSFVKEGVKKSIYYKRKKAGYTKEGIPARLNVKKTMESAIARRIATKSQGKKPRYLDDVDIRYDYHTTYPLPAKTAVMFCLMDVSASMGEHEKVLAKKFFILLYLFLHKEYESIEIRFVRHTHVAKEVTEEEFFYGRLSGGTTISVGLRLIEEIIDAEYDLDTTNIYLAQCSDGDNWPSDDEEVEKIIAGGLLNKLQYYAYLQVESEDRVNARITYPGYDFYNTMSQLARKHQKINISHATDADQIYPALAELFKKED